MADSLTIPIVLQTQEVSSRSAQMEKEFTRAVRAMEAALKRLEKKEEGTGKKRGSSWKKWGRLAKGAITSVSRALSNQLVQSLSKAASAVLKLSSDFETGLAAISTVLNDDLLPRMGEVRQELVRLSTEGDQSLNTLSQALRLALSSGISDLNTAIDLTKQADIMATAALTSTETAMKALISTVNAYGTTAGDVGAISDQFFMTQKLGATNVELLAKNLGKVMPIAKAAGVRLSEVNASLAALTRSGLSTAMATTALRSMLSQILRPSKQSAEMFDKLGISYGDAAIKSKGFAGVLKQIRERVGNNTTQLGRLFPNIRAMTAATALAGAQFGTFNEALRNIQNSAGATQRAYEKMQNTWKFTSDQFKNILNSIWIDLAGEAFDQLKGLLKGVNVVLLENKSNFGAWGKSAGKWLTKAATAILGVYKNLKAIASWVDRYGSMWLTVGRVVTGVGTLGLSELAWRKAKKNFAEASKEVANLVKKGKVATERQRALAEITLRVADAFKRRAVPEMQKYHKQLGHILTKRFKGERLTKVEIALQKAITDGIKRGNKERKKQIALAKQQAEATARLQKKEAERRKKKAEEAGEKQARRDDRLISQAIRTAKLRVQDQRRDEREAERARQKAAQEAERRRKTQARAQIGGLKARARAMEQQYQIEQRLASLRQSIAARGMPTSEVGAIEQSATRQINAAQQSIRKLNLQIKEVQIRMAGGLLGQGAGQQRITELQQVVSLREQEIMLIQKQAAVQTQGLSVASRLHRKFAQDAMQSQAQLAGTVHDMSKSFVNGIGNMISTVFQGIVAGEKNVLEQAGKMFLDMLAGMAMQMGAYFLASGTAQTFVPPYTGAGAIAGGLALMALGGALKGAGSLITGGAPSVSTGGGGGGGGARMPSVGGSTAETDRGMPGQSTRMGQKPVQIFYAVSRAPWSRRSSQDDFRDFREWAAAESRATGTHDFTSRPTISGSRRLG